MGHPAWTLSDQGDPAVAGVLPTVPALAEASSRCRWGWSAELSVTDRFDAFDDTLDDPNPRSGNTTWQEIQRLSPIPIEQSVPDQQLPGGLSYDGRLNAITQLASNLGGVPHLTVLVRCRCGEGRVADGDRPVSSLMG